MAQRSCSFYWQLFRTTFLISAFTVGGGYVIIPLLKAKFVDELRWLEEKEALDLVAVAQTAPGVVAVNASIVMGYRMAGAGGLFTALLATVLPPLISISVIAYCYDYFAQNTYVQYLLKGMQCGATAIIIDVAFKLAQSQIRKKLVLPFLIISFTLIANYLFNVSISCVILADALIGACFMRAAKYD